MPPDGSVEITLTDSGSCLGTQYPLFGKLIAGQDVLRAIENMPTGAQDRPSIDVVIKSITITER